MCLLANIDCGLHTLGMNLGCNYGTSTSQLFLQYALQLYSRLLAIVFLVHLLSNHGLLILPIYGLLILPIYGLYLTLSGTCENQLLSFLHRTNSIMVATCAQKSQLPAFLAILGSDPTCTDSHIWTPTHHWPHELSLGRPTCNYILPFKPIMNMLYLC